MPTLRPLRDYDEKDVINFYTVSGAVIDSTYQILATKGTFVKITGDGVRMDVEPVQMLGNYGQFSVNNFVAQRYGVAPQVAIAQVNDTPVGMLLFDVRELDENLQFLKYNPRKAAEMEAAISGTAVPIVTRGVFLYSGVRTGSAFATGAVGVPVTAGAPAYLGDNGEICTSGITKVGIFLGKTGAFVPSGLNGTDLSATALVKINL